MDPTTPPNEKPEVERGITCRDCGCGHLWVIWTRHQDRKIVRRRECRHCGRRVTTTERVIG